MKIERKYSHEYVCCLPELLEKRIMKAVKKAVSTLRLSKEEKTVAIEDANHSKVCDLTDTINIVWVS